MCKILLKLLGQIMSFKVTDTKLEFETQKSEVSLAFPSALEKRPMNSKFCMCMIGFEIFVWFMSSSSCSGHQFSQLANMKIKFEST